MGWRAALSRWVYGSRARAAADAARADVARDDLPTCVARRLAVPLSGRPRPLALRGFASALDGHLGRLGETGPCLVRALALLGEARRRGYAPSFVVGVLRGKSGPASHAWLALEGRPFCEDPGTPARYETLAVLPRAER